MAARRKIRQHGARERKLRLEQLETRALLAGNISVDVAGGNLIVRGDNRDNQVAILQLGSGEYAVIGFNGTEVEGEAEPFVVSGVNGNIDVDLKKGNDLLGVGNDVSGLIALAQALGFGDELGDAEALEEDLLDLLESADAPERLEVPRHLLVRTGDGHDGVGVSADIGRGVNVNLGNGDNTFALVNSTVEDNVIARSGSGADDLLVSVSLIDGVLDANMGNGVNSVTVSDTGIGKSAVIVSGKNSDYIDIADSAIEDNLIVRTGDGADEVYAHSHGAEGMVIDGLVDIDTGSQADYVELAGDVGRDVNIRTGSHDDEVFLLDLEIRKNLFVNLGAGNDDLWGEDVDVNGNAVLDAGSGHDEVEIEDDSEVGGKFTAIMGSGNDFLKICNSFAESAFLDGGSGNDELQSDLDLDDLPDGYTVKKFEFFSECEEEEEEE